MKHLMPISLLAFSYLFFASPTMADEPTFQWKADEGRSLTLAAGDEVVWKFNYASEQGKPYFHPVRLPGGPVLTCNSPADHPWHHALWFSWKYLNGKNYWEANRQTGQSEGLTEWSDVEINTSDDGSATIAMKLTYRPNEEGSKTVLTEARTMVLSAPDEKGQYHVDWTATFTAGDEPVKFDRTPLPGEPGGVAYGGYAGLSLRLTPELIDREAASTDGPVEFNAQNRYRGKHAALDYNGTIDGQAWGVAVCDHPKNMNAPTPWYVIRSNPMRYFSPAVICYKPFTLDAGDSFTLRYRVIPHADRWDAERLSTESDAFVGQ